MELMYGKSLQTSEKLVYFEQSVKLPQILAGALTRAEEMEWILKYTTKHF